MPLGRSLKVGGNSEMRLNCRGPWAPAESKDRVKVLLELDAAVGLKVKL